MINFKLIIESSETNAGRIFDLFIQGFIIISLLSFTIETLPNLSEVTISYLRLVEIFCVSIFTIEYISRVLVATNKSAFCFSFFGIIDLLAILPFYFLSGVDLRSVRAFRLLRLIRILKLARYNDALERMRKAFIEAKEELIIFFPPR
jgi:voltage-gated potassium channel